MEFAMTSVFPLLSRSGRTSYNWSANADPLQQEAASPQWLRSGCLQR